MSSNTEQTKKMLAKHHGGDGEHFAQLMVDTFENRFNEEFWQLWQQTIVPVLGEHPKVLDLGTGPGTFLSAVKQRYPQVTPIGVECAQYMLDAVKGLPDDAQLIEADLHDPQLPFDDNSVDAAVSSVVVHEMYQPVRMFHELLRVLKPGGRFYLRDWVRVPLQQYLQEVELDVFDKNTDARQLEDLFLHFVEHNRFSTEDLVFMLERTGFKVLESQLLKQGQHAWILAEKSR